MAPCMIITVAKVRRYPHIPLVQRQYIRLWTEESRFESLVGCRNMNYRPVLFIIGGDNLPFKSAKQRRYLFAKHPGLAKRWARKYGAKVGGGKTKAQKRKKS